MSNVVNFLTRLAAIMEGISLDDSLRIMEAFGEFPLTVEESIIHNIDSPEGLVLFARSTPEVMKALPMTKIAAIKALRTAASEKFGGAYIGLREAKDAVDTICAKDFPTPPAPAFDAYRTPEPCYDPCCTPSPY